MNAIAVDPAPVGSAAPPAPAPGARPPARQARSEIGPGPLAWLIAAMTAATAPFVADLPPWLTLGAAGVAWYRIHGERRGGRLPPRGIGLIAVVAAIALLWASGRIGYGLVNAAPGLVAFMWMKLIELRGERDVQVCGCIVLFLAIANVLDYQALPQALWALGTCALALAAVVRFQVRGPAPIRLPLAIAAALAAAALPLALVLFLFVPRPQVGLPFTSVGATSGISDLLRPGDIAQVSLNQQVAMRVETLSGALPPLAQCYWRALVLWDTDGSRWMRGRTGMFVDRRFAVGRPVGAAPTGDASGEDAPIGDPPGSVRAEITLMPHRAAWLALLDCPVELVEEARPAGGGVQEFGRRVNRIRSYVVAADASARLHDASPAVLARAVRVPAGIDPRVAALAGELQAAAAGDPAQAVETTLAWFRAGGFTYTTDPGIMGGDAAASFLFERRAGFCGHFASSFALLMRLAGVPARVVVGYRGGEINPLGGFVAVRQAHAHAWCEVWLGDGWRRVDPTDTVTAVAEAGAAMARDSQTFSTAVAAGSQAGPGWFARRFSAVGTTWDYVEATWDRWALGYDDDTREGLLARLGLLRHGWWGIVAAVAIGLFLVLGSTLIVLVRRSGAADPLVAAYGRLGAMLAAAGVRRESWEGPLDFAERAATRLPEAAPAIRTACARYARLRYGGDDTTRADLRRLSAEIRAVRRAIPTRTTATG